MTGRIKQGSTARSRPIIFSDRMVRAIIAGTSTKTQTRRIVKNAPPGTLEVVLSLLAHPGDLWDFRRSLQNSRAIRCPYGRPGDRLWVREAWTHDAESTAACRAATEDALSGGLTYGPYYRATEPAPETLRWRSPLFMPRWASRITLEITEVRVQPLHAISEADARAEGVRVSDAAIARQETVDTYGMTPFVGAFACLWDSINGDTPWSSNPWVWCVSFRRV